MATAGVAIASAARAVEIITAVAAMRQAEDITRAVVAADTTAQRCAVAAVAAADTRAVESRRHRHVATAAAVGVKAAAVAAARCAAVVVVVADTRVVAAAVDIKAAVDMTDTGSL